MSGSTYNLLHPGNILGLGGNDAVFQIALVGDASMDGHITLGDYELMDAAYLSGTTNATWAQGDFNYDGVVDYRDYAMADAAYAVQSGTEADGMIALACAEFGAAYTGLLSAAESTGSSVPEPASLTLLGAGGLGLLAKRRARRGGSGQISSTGLNRKCARKNLNARTTDLVDYAMGAIGHCVKRRICGRRRRCAAADAREQGFTRLLKRERARELRCMRLRREAESAVCLDGGSFLSLSFLGAEK